MHWQEFGERADDRPAANVVDHRLAALEGAGAVPVPPLPSGHVRRARHRPVGPADRIRGIQLPGVYAADTLAVLDATDTPTACSSAFVRRGVGAAGRRRSPSRVRARDLGAAFRWHHASRPQRLPFDERLDTTDGWAKYNRYYWLEGLPRLPRVLLRAGLHRAAFDQADRGLHRVGSRHRSGKLVASDEGMDACGLESFRSVCERVSAPVLVIHGDGDELAHHARGAALATVTGGD